jgi:hypothetical protein
MCDYNLYNTGGTDANYHRLPIFTKTVDECQVYFDKPLSNRDYSQLKSKDGKHVLGYICLPWCDIEKDNCSSDKIKINDDNTWSVNNRKTNYNRRINKYQPAGIWNSGANKCILLGDKKKTCDSLDSVCCGAKFAGASGNYCDRLAQNQLFLTACHTEGSRSECCDHGTCESGICVCDVGYAGNCCECDDGYHKDANGNCVSDEVYCCNQTTFQVSKVPLDQCTGTDKKIVPDNSANNCWPEGKSWCSNDKNDCKNITAPSVWNTYRDKAGDLITDCNTCFQPDLYYCDNKKTCGSSLDDLQTYTVASFMKVNSDKNIHENDVSIYFFAGALFVLLFCFIIFIILCINKKKK